MSHDLGFWASWTKLQNTQGIGLEFVISKLKKEKWKGTIKRAIYNKKFILWPRKNYMDGRKSQLSIFRQRSAIHRPTDSAGLPMRASCATVCGIFAATAISADIYEFIENFSEKDAWSYVAAAQGWPKEEEGFVKYKKCGKWATYKGERSPKTGALYWHCPMKFDVTYYGIIDKNGNKLKTAFTKEELTPKKKKGQKIKKFFHAGCEYFLKKSRSFSKTI